MLPVFTRYLAEAMIINEKKREAENVTKVVEIASKIFGDKDKIPVNFSRIF